MGLAKVAVQHCAHHIAAGDQNGAMRLHAAIVQLECDVVEEVLVDEVLLQVRADLLKSV